LTLGFGIVYLFMRIIQSKFLTVEQTQSLFALWNTEYPQKLTYGTIVDFENYLSSIAVKMHYLLLDFEGSVQGWAFSFFREQNVWFAILINSDYHKKGLGSCLLYELKKNNTVLNGWVIDHENDFKKNGIQYSSPLPFYCKNDFIVCNEVRLENEKISATKIVWESKCY
jgi:hypothetical protein